MYAVITAFTDTPEVKALGDLTHDNKLNYCKLHNYKYFEFGGDHPKDMSRGPGWMKLPLIKETMLANPDIEWFFWIDADAFFMNYRIRLETIVDPWSFFMVGQDCNAINVGTFFIKNCKLAVDFLDDVWTRGPQPGNWLSTAEQGQIAYMGLMDKYRQGFSVCSNKKFNAYLHKCSPGAMYCAMYEPGDFVVHLPGIVEKERITSVMLSHVIKP
ncbi:MAG: hypothetical protein WC378_07965 [Opitutaceae bacterium]|jgi:hypothetical protein